MMGARCVRVGGAPLSERRAVPLCPRDGGWHAIDFW